MKRIAFHLSRTTLWCIFFLLILAAVVLVSGRFLVGYVDNYRHELESQISAAVGAPVLIDDLSGSWVGFNPAVKVSGVKVLPPMHHSLVGSNWPAPAHQVLPAIRLRTMLIELDSWSSLMNFQPVFKAVLIDGLRIRLHEGRDRQFSLTGFPLAKKTQPASTDTQILEKLLGQLVLQKAVKLQNIKVHIQTPDGEGHWITVPELAYKGGSYHQRLLARVQLGTEAPITIISHREGAVGKPKKGVIQGYIDIPEQDFSRWSGLLARPGFALTEARGGGKLWFELNKRQSWELQGNVQVSQLAMQDSQLQIPALSNIQAGVRAEGKVAGPWELWLQQFSFQASKAPWPTTDLYLKHEESNYTLAVNQLELGRLKPILARVKGLPDSARSLFNTLNPRGSLQDIAFTIDPEQPLKFDLSAKVKDVAVDAWEDAPSAEGVSGTLRMSALQGELQLDTDHLSLGLTELFRDGWQWGAAKGRIFWFVDNDAFTLISRNLQIDGDIGQVKGQLRLDFPFDERPSEMGLFLGIKDANAKLAGRYVPAKIPLDEGLVNWLDSAIQGGTVTDGIFLYNGAISDTGSDYDSSYDMFYRVHDGVLRYEPHWPELKKLQADVAVTNSAVAVTAQSAELLDGSKLEHATVALPEHGSEKIPTLKVAAKITTNGADAKRILTESPLDEVLEGQAKEWQLSGPLGVDLKLAIPFAEGADDHIQVAVDTQGVDFDIDSADLSIQGINGQAIYDSKLGLNAKKLTGSLLGHQALFSIASKQQGQKWYTDINAKGAVNIKAIEQQWPVLSPYFTTVASGQTDYSARLRIVEGAAPELSIQTDLDGVALKLPAPYSKAAKQKMPSNLQLTLASPMQLRFAYGIKLQGLMKIHDDNVDALHIHLGRSTSLRLPKQGIRLNGSLARLDLDPWLEFANRLKGSKAATTTSDTEGKPKSNTSTKAAASSSASAIPQLEVAGLNIGLLTIGDKFYLDHAKINATTTKRGLWLELNSQQAAGTATIPAATGGRWNIALSQLQLPEISAEEGKDQTQSPKDPLAGFNPASLPPLSLSIDKLQVGDQVLGAISLESRPHPTGLHISGLSLQMPNLNINGDLSWNAEHGLQNTFISLDFSSDDIGKLLHNLGYARTLEAKESNTHINMYWPGSPAAFALANLRGELDLKMKNGRFVDVDPTANALKVFGILNFTSITRRLRLDFSDLFQSGIAFDKTTAKLRFRDGLVTTEEPIRIQGPSSDFNLSGQFDYNRNTIDMGLTVSLPVTQNLPLLALLIGQPQIGGAILLFDKLFGDKVQRIASVQYLLTGKLDDPTVVFNKPFSNKDDKK